MDEKLTTIALACAGALAAFGAVTWAKRSPASPAFPTSNQLITAYVSPQGYKPHVHLERGNERYVMLDVIPEDGDILRFIHVQIIDPGRTAPIVWTYAQYRVDCRQYQMTVLGESETLSDMLSRNDAPLWYRPNPGTLQNSGAYTACRSLNRI
ncbi:hypothetical protein [Methylobacterium aerolatum]|uniref:Uncharacterized protein n=1 Tax=Methylobacterium aerolatum TaxID=418708 RepID=A0ABU0I5X8_9HYPH|nr:hypothetical protein [Methylobacterium aerolatum]MDQ0450023.1 hypothetical protein [Methylobacterium aerolatum]